MPLALLLATTATCIYLGFTIVSYLHYPTNYSPTANWLSDLGNPTQNPSGAVYYNTGDFIVSLVLILFFAALYSWNIGDKKMKIFLGLSQAVGIVLAVAFLVTSMAPLGVNDSVHSTASIILFISIGCFEIFSASAIRKNPARAKWMPPFGIAVAMANFVLAVSFNFGNFFLGEWIMIGLFIIYILTLAVTQSKTAQVPMVQSQNS
jgi:hypothetical membrane protein